MSRAVFLALGCAAVVQGCAAEGGPVTAIQDAIAEFVLPPEQAAQLGSRMAQQIEGKKQLHPSDALQSTVSSVGQRIVAAAGDLPEAYDFSFKVVEDPSINAFALPGGKIYATSGLMQAAQTEAQLASVLAHEVAHVTERHIADRLATSYGVQALGGAALGTDAGMVTQLAASVLQQGFLLKYSREQELQADRVGLDYLAEAGYDPRAAITMFRKLAEGGASEAPVFLSSHPAMEERIERIEQTLARAG